MKRTNDTETEVTEIYSFTEFLTLTRNPPAFTEKMGFHWKFLGIRAKGFCILGFGIKVQLM